MLLTFDTVTKVFSERNCCPSIGTSTMKYPPELFRAPTTSAAVVQAEACMKVNEMLHAAKARFV